MLMILFLPQIWPADAHARFDALFVPVWPGPGQLMLIMPVLALSLTQFGHGLAADAHDAPIGALFVPVRPRPGQLMLMMLVLAHSLSSFGQGLAS